MIVAEGLRKRFGELVAVAEVSLRAEDGQITGLLGPNGAGKTTTLRLLYGLMKPDHGTVQIDEVDVVAAPLAAQARVGVLPDAHGLYPRLSAREHVRYFGELQGLRGDALEQRISTLVERLDMRGIVDRRAQGFSQGERMKVSLARALVHGPNNVILDEPTNGLDVMSTRAMRKLIRGLRDEGKCVLFSSHVMQEVSALCDVIVIVADGRVVARGTPDELRELSGHRDLEDAFVKLTGVESVESLSAAGGQAP
ncbi:putative ABC transporter ATP-binding protein YbhF [Enhygromyxa salina]|uniref:Putative ABC transporter ATP-binding protein YbhF n=1 Tax=Enhygromyxa salina TaxID=215803 RepID=A0A2S9Y2P4_9BACT|nr:ATP-binding cassette domain-containing protein [Enhygromyxa salina]PRP99374.1 putative ABC transporter ATP-binding protein YbhF [Enhygromyxa salina]